MLDATQLLQFLLSGLTVGAVYALVALGFTLIYNANGIINFAQGEFVMLGGMLASFFLQSGIPLWGALCLAVILPVGIGVMIEKGALERLQPSETFSLILITIGLALMIRGLVAVFFGKGTQSLPAFSGETPILLWGAVLQRQSLWVWGGLAVSMCLLHVFFTRTLMGKAILACSANPVAAQLTGIPVQHMLLVSFILASALGALGGILITPITLTTYDTGILLGLKGFVAAVLGGLGSNMGAVLGGLAVGILESLGAGYISSAYKDALPFLVILLILFWRPSGLLGKRNIERV